MTIAPVGARFIGDPLEALFSIFLNGQRQASAGASYIGDPLDALVYVQSLLT